MSWPEVLTAKKENRHELILAGADISQKIEKSGLDVALFELTSINFLDIHDTCLSELPDGITKLTSLQTLVVHSNKLQTITPDLDRLSKLKLLDLSRNELKQVPDAIADLANLYSINVSNNNLTSFPALAKNIKLSVLDLSNNKLSLFPDVCRAELVNLSELKLNGNEITEIPSEISTLPSLKILLVSANKIKMLPAELANCTKLKELDLKSNPIADRRLLKLIDQCRTKQVLDYVKQHIKSKDAKKNETASKEPIKDQVEYKYTIKVQHWNSNSIKIIVTEEIKSVRPHIAACLVSNLSFDQDVLKKFIKAQTKLHETICDKRNAATIATHDFNKLVAGDLTYTAMLPNKLKIKPLNRNELVSGANLFERLKAEADEFRKEKKRNVYSGIHKYLYLLEGQEKYPCLINTKGEVISFPPITNSDITKISSETKSMLIEVTSSTSQNVCRKVLDALIKESLELLQPELEVQQIKVTDLDGNLKSVYPSKTDLLFADKEINVIRE